MAFPLMPIPIITSGGGSIEKTVIAGSEVFWPDTAYGYYTGNFSYGSMSPDDDWIDPQYYIKGVVWWSYGALELTVYPKSSADPQGWQAMWSEIKIEGPTGTTIIPKDWGFFGNNSIWLRSGATQLFSPGTTYTVTIS